MALSSFIGRERELVEIKRLLPGKRLLTLVGIGGIGKTRLALQAAAEVMDAYRDGVWLVELGSISDPALVATSVAQVLGIQEKAGTPLTQSLCAQLKARRLLVILDNCEHVLDACATLTDAILRNAPAPAIIATSREPLQVEGEQSYPLQALSLPDPSAGEEEIGGSEAVQLLVERIRQQLPDFKLTAARTPAVAELCIHLDGIPLALELAAARVRSLSIEKINARLHDRFRLLTSTTRTLPRQQTLRSMLDWSFDLLAEQERAVLRRFAIFAGGFTLEAASAVASDAVIDEFAVIDLLSQLVARSLVVADPDVPGGRYRLLETTRAYAMEKLTEAEEIDAIQRRHAHYYCVRFETANNDRTDLPEADWNAIYLPEVDNVRAALDWAFGACGDAAIGIALTGAAAPVWINLSLFREGVRRLEVAVARVSTETPASDEVLLWFWLSQALTTSAPARAATAAERAAELYRRLDNASGLGQALIRLGRMWVFMGRFEDAGRVFAEAFPLLERNGMPKMLAPWHREMGALKMLTGDVAGARMHFEKALTLFRDAGAESAALVIVLNLADMTWSLGDLDAALARFREAVMLLRKSPLAREMLGHCLTNLAGLHTERGELDEALAAAREGLPLRRDAGSAWSTFDHLALRAALAGKLMNAARLAGYDDSAFTAKDSSRQPNEARAHDRLQALLRDKLDPGELKCLLVEGANMSEDEACRLALEE